MITPDFDSDSSIPSSNGSIASFILNNAVKSVQIGKDDFVKTSYSLVNEQHLSSETEYDTKSIQLLPTEDEQINVQLVDSPKARKKSIKKVSKLKSKSSRSSLRVSTRVKLHHAKSESYMIPNVMKTATKVKKPLKRMVTRTPADEWADCQKKKEEKQKLKQKIKSGWEVRQALFGKENICAEDLYLNKVHEKRCDLVEALLKINHINMVKLNIDATNQLHQSALHIAIENEDRDMCKLLLQNEVEIRDALFHAIEKDFRDGVELILKHNPCLGMKIVGNNYFFPPDISPYRYAAWKNKYEMLKILYKYGHRLKEAGGWYEGIMFAWESSNDRKWYYEAKSSPAHITLISEKENMDPFQECFKTIKELRTQAHQEPMFDERFKQLQVQVEGYMCKLLDKVRSSEELSSIFKYDFIKIKNIGKKVKFKKDPIIHHSSSVASLLDEACENRLYDFVTHPYSQLAIDYLKYRHTPSLHSTWPVKNVFMKICIGVLFPLLSIFYIINSRSRFGLWISYPPISFHCHMASDFTFIALLVLNIFKSMTYKAYLGMPPTVLEILIVIWITAKWLQEAQELNRRGAKSYFTDSWNYNDLLFLFLFTVAIFFRTMDYVENSASSEKVQVYRAEWSDYCWRLIAESFQAYAYVFLVLRLLGILRTDRTLGPLQVSLARMMVNIFQFLAIFAMIILAFSMGFTELLSYYGTSEGRTFLCNDTSKPDCDIAKSNLFTSIPVSLNSLFWLLFGQMEVPKWTGQGHHSMTWSVGHSLLIFYHVTAVIVLINMLIAMMSQTYEITSSRSECEWKFIRTYYWIRFIRKEAVLPPPMNLIPSSVFVAKRCASLFNINCFLDVKNHEKENNDVEMKKININNSCNKRSKSIGEQNREHNIHKLVQRFKFKEYH